MTLALVTSSSCAIKIYLVDRQTVLEDEAAGEWPEFEKEILRKTESSSPTPFPVVAQSSRKARMFNVLNGELASGDKPAHSVPPPAEPAGK